MTEYGRWISLKRHYCPTGRNAGEPGVRQVIPRKWHRLDANEERTACGRIWKWLIFGQWVERDLEVQMDVCARCAKALKREEQ